MEIFGFEVGITYFDIPLILLGIFGVYFFFKMWFYFKREIKTQQKEGKKFVGKVVSRFISSSVITISILLILALVISTIAINIIFAIQEEFLIYIDAMAKPWQFRNFLPVLFVILVGFISIYPLIELLMLAGKNAKIPTNIHQFLKRKFLRFKAPFSHIIAILLFIVIILGPPALISYILLRLDVRVIFNYAFTELTLIGFIYLAYLILGPILYLTYFSNFSKAIFISRGRHIGKYKVGAIRKFINGLFVFVAILSLISSIYSLIQNFPIIWGDYPALTQSYLEIERNGGFFESIIDTILALTGSTTTELRDQVRLFFVFIPIDFLLFILTTVLFGFLGFYSQFWQKQKLNKAQIIWFAAYTACGLSLNVFLNILLKWPWVLPDFAIFEMADISHQIILTRFFGPSLLISKILIVGFFIYHGFYNKNLSGLVSDELDELVQKRERKHQEKLMKKKKNLGLSVVETDLNDNDDMKTQEDLKMEGSDLKTEEEDLKFDTENIDTEENHPT
jgi:hypothetical protein